jgi:hypothetical protein
MTSKRGSEDNGHAELPQQLSALDRAIQTAIGADQTVGLDDDPIAKKFPSVWQWLTQIYWGRDYVVTPAVITLRAGPGGVVASLTHRDLAMSVEVVVPHLGDALPALEEAISGTHAKIKAWGRQTARVRKRKPGN